MQAYLKNTGHAAILAAVMTGALVLTGCRAKGVDGEEWILSQGKTLNTLELYMKNLDDTDTLYTAGGLTDNNFKAEMEIRQQEYDIVYKEFQQELEENPIKVGSHTYESKRGYDGLLKLWEDVGKITGLLESMAENGTTPDAVSYQYIAYQPTLSKDLAEYSAAFSLISGSDYMLDTEEETETEITTRKNE